MTDAPRSPPLPPAPDLLQELRRQMAEVVREHSIQASATMRQLAYAGIALCWLFKLEVAGDPALPREVILPLFLLALTLAADLLQSIAGIIVGFFRLDATERRHLGPVRATVYGFLHRHPPTGLLFWTKCLALVAAYGVLLYYFGTHLLAY
jgi:hypothetical protein